MCASFSLIAAIAGGKLTGRQRGNPGLRAPNRYYSSGNAGLARHFLSADKVDRIANVGENVRKLVDTIFRVAARVSICVGSAGADSPEYVAHSFILFTRYQLASLVSFIGVSGR